MPNDYMATMGQIATVCRRIVGGRDINGYLIHGASLLDIGPLAEELQRLLNEYDQQMLEASCRESVEV